MTTWVHRSKVAELVQKEGYVWVPAQRWRHKRWSEDWAELEHPDDTCLAVLRFDFCRLDKGHRGRCSSVTFYCDGCNKHRRGAPASSPTDRDGSVLVNFCWFCVSVLDKERPPWW